MANIRLDLSINLVNFSRWSTGGYHELHKTTKKSSGLVVSNEKKLKPVPSAATWWAY
jgi:hypothetical protein